MIILFTLVFTLFTKFSVEFSVSLFTVLSATEGSRVNFGLYFGKKIFEIIFFECILKFLMFFRHLLNIAVRLP